MNVVRELKLVISVVGLCGETSLSNAKASWTTMMQGLYDFVCISLVFADCQLILVYEYWSV